MEKNYWERKYGDSRDSCYHWYWGSSGKFGVPENTCMKKGANRCQCTGLPCRRFVDTHKQVMANLKQILKD